MPLLKQSYPKPICYSPILKYVFIHIPKCAGTSIHRAFHLLHSGRSLPEDIARYHKHAKAAQVRSILGPAWNECFKFAFVRNPWDLMVSSYHWWLNYAETFPHLFNDAQAVRKLGSFSAFVRSHYGSTMLNEHAGRDLLDWISEDNRIVVDFVGRYETLGKDWQTICKRLQAAPPVLTWENRVERLHYRTFYDEESAQLVARRFAETIRLFDYHF